jgi:tRNA-dihydrouridine synthase 2
MVDKRIIGSTRSVNEEMGTIDYIKQDSIVFRTCEKEKSKLILQIGTADPDLALEAALTLKEDISGIDVNCGCPKHFSISGGMGAALLKKPDHLVNILKTLVEKSGLPVTCKIRLLDKTDPEPTKELVKRLAGTGIKAIAVHCRTPEQRPHEKGNQDIFSFLSECIDIPLIANGDFHTREQALDVINQGKASSVMFARTVISNPSVFRENGLLPIEDVVEKYVKYALRYEIKYQNTKYVLSSLYPDLQDERGQKIRSARSFKEIALAFDLLKYYQSL